MWCVCVYTSQPLRIIDKKQSREKFLLRTYILRRRNVQAVIVLLMVPMYIFFYDNITLIQLTTILFFFLSHTNATQTIIEIQNNMLNNIVFVVGIVVNHIFIIYQCLYSFIGSLPHFYSNIIMRGIDYEYNILNIIRTCLPSLFP